MKEKKLSHFAKLKPAEIRKLRKLYAAKKANTYELAEKFGVSQTTVSNILTGKIYRLVV